MLHVEPAYAVAFDLFIIYISVCPTKLHMECIIREYVVG